MLDISSHILKLFKYETANSELSNHSCVLSSSSSDKQIWTIVSSQEPHSFKLVVVCTHTNQA